MKYREHLPQLDGGLFLTDGGLETVLIFQEGIDLPAFAAFPLLAQPGSREKLKTYFDPFLQIAKDAGAGLVLESPTWRANPDWGLQLGYDSDTLAAANFESVEFVAELRERHETAATPMPISGCIGPRGDGYTPGVAMSADEAAEYHRQQIATFSITPADFVSALTMNYVEEAVGVVYAAAHLRMPVVISFTVETDGRLPSGEPLGDAIQRCDEATGGYAAYYMVNCAHPTHFEKTLAAGGEWRRRLRGVRANASTKSHAELDEATDLDDGDPAGLGADVAVLARHLPSLNVVGGCCGTDHRHIAAICQAMLAGSQVTSAAVA